MAKIQHVRDLDDEPRIGQRYRVPCVTLVNDHGGECPWWVPIIGPRHDDSDLGVEFQHWHQDWRFISNTLLQRVWHEYEDDYSDEWQWHQATHRHVVSHHVRGPEDRVKVCYRRMIPHPDIFPLRRGLEDRWKGHVLKGGCKVCPHRGMPLNGLPVDKDGGVICPGHGLKWHAETGALLSRRSTNGEA